MQIEKTISIVPKLIDSHPGKMPATAWQNLGVPPVVACDSAEQEVIP
jgi:hypothetical protein